MIPYAPNKDESMRRMHNYIDSRLSIAKITKEELMSIGVWSKHIQKEFMPLKKAYKKANKKLMKLEERYDREQFKFLYVTGKKVSKDSR